MPTPRHQTLVDLVKQRFQSIRTANGYNTDLGLRVTFWRDLAAVNWQTEELPAVNLRDRSAECEQVMIGKQEHTITFEADAATKAANLDIEGRKILADIIKAIGVDRLWTDAGTGVQMAQDTLPRSWEMDVKASGTNVAFVRFTFTIRLRMANFDPYTA